MRGRVLRSQSGQYWVKTDEGLIHCSLRGRFKRGKARTDLVVIGDWVRVRPLSETGEGVIEEVEPRGNRFARRQPGGRGRYKEHVLVANLDWLIVVMACETPEPNPRLIDRFLVIAELDDIPAVLVANKVDEVGEGVAAERFGQYASLGYPVLYTSATERIGIDSLRSSVAGKVCAFVGPSGVGKSSLLNAIDPALELAVGALSESLHKGKHTTRVAQLHELEGGGLLADTPGIRELATFSLPREALARCFPEMRPYTERCRFAGCSHDHEPDCAVVAAVERGEISRHRHDSYLRILHDQER